MAREKKDGKHINLYIEKEILEQLENIVKRLDKRKLWQLKEF